MSTDISAAISSDALSAAPKPRKRLWTRDLRTARIVRYAVGVTATAALAFGINWPLFFFFTTNYSGFTGAAGTSAHPQANF